MRCSARKATVTMKIDDDDPRYFNGYITRMQRGDRHGPVRKLHGDAAPWLWFVTRTVNSKVFQKKSVKEIVTEVLDDYSTDYEWRLIAASLYPKLDYCVQYHETDFDFVSRLLEDVGIYYFFEHTDSKHTLVLIDAMAKHKSKPDQGPDQLGQHDEIFVDGDQLARRPGGARRPRRWCATSTTWRRPPRSRARARPRKRPPKLGDAEVLRVHRQGASRTA